MNIFNKLIIIFFVLFVFTPIVVNGQSLKTDDKQIKTGGIVELKNPLGDIDSPQVFIGQVIKGVLGIVGSLALAMFIYGGFLWMTAAGSSEKIEKGKGVLIWAVIGLIVIFTSYAVVSFVFTDILSAPGIQKAATQ